MKRIIPLAAAALCASAAIPHAAMAADAVAVDVTRENAWEFGAFIYAYYPDINSKVTFRNGQSSDVSVNAGDIYNNLKFGMIGAFELRKGDWGGFTDVIYMDVGAFNSGVRNFTIGKVGLPADVSASANFDLKATVWTLAATYRPVNTQAVKMDVLAGARLLDIKESLQWTLNGNIGPIALPGRAGYQSAKDHFVDGVVGLKGRIGVGRDLKWFIPYYGDVGTGDSDLTWQVATGLGYAFKWGEIIGGWRYLDYQFKSDSKIDSMSLNGPLLGVAFHW
jgi:hypothetical protein